MNFYYQQDKLFISLFFIFATSTLAGQNISPSVKIITSGAITDFFIEDPEIILVTDAGTIEWYNFKTGQKTNFIQLPKIKDFMGDEVPAKIFSVDKLNDQLIYVTQGIHGFRNVVIRQRKDEKKVIDANIDRLLVKKVRFINEKEILLGLMSNEIMLFDIEKNEMVYKLPISAYTFSDFDLSRDNQFVYTSDESGIVHKIDIQKGKVVKDFSCNNVDNIYKLVYRNETIITAGQDRRVGVYQALIGDKYYLQKNFLIYCVGLNENGTVGAYTADEENNITLFDINTKSEITKLTGHQSVITKIEFVDDHTLISASDDRYLMIWKIE